MRRLVGLALLVLSTLGRPELRGLALRMRLDMMPRTDTQNGSGEWVFYRWVS